VLLALRQVVTPVRVRREGFGDSGQPRQRAWGGAAGVGGVQTPVQDGGDVPRGVDLAPAQGGGERRDRVVAVDRDEGQVAAQRGVGGGVGDPG